MKQKKHPQYFSTEPRKALKNLQELEKPTIFALLFNGIEPKTK